MKKKLYFLLGLTLTIFYIFSILTVINILSYEEVKEETVFVVVEKIPEEETEEIQLTPEQEYLKRLEALDKIKNNKDWYIAYKNLNEEYKEIGEIESLYDVYDDEEILLLQKVVESECFGSDFDSKVHVASVVLNRVEDERFPDTLKEVVTQPNQFCYCKNIISEDTKLACEYAFEISNEADECLWFHSMNKTQKFSGGEYVFTDNVNHHFYK